MIIIENEGKINFGKIIFKSLGIKVILICVIVTVLLSAFTWKVLVDDGSYKEDKSNTGYVAKQKVGEKTQNIVEKDDGWGIDIDIEATVDEIIEELDKNNGVLDRYIGEGNQKEYLTAFIKAELITQYPDLRSNVSEPVPEGEFQGCIQIHRAMSNGTTEILTYVPYDIFSSYIDDGNSEATNHFTLDSEGNIVVAGWTRTTTNITSNEPNVENVTNQVDYEITTKAIPYKSSVAEYSMPFDFLWALTVSGQDAEFAYNIAQLALKSEIIITVQDNLTTTVTDSIEKYDIQEKNVKKAECQVTYNKTTTYPSHTQTSDTSEIPYKTVKNIKTEICSVKANITKADTWIQKYENTYSNEIPEGSGEPIPGEPQKIDDTEFTDTGAALVVDDEFKKEVAEAMIDYLTELCGGENEYKKAMKEGKCVPKINSMTHKKYSRKINHEITTTTTTTTNTYIIGTPTVIEKVDKNASEDNFVTLFINSKNARTNILSAPDWLFTMLENSSATANMVDVVKYLLYKATDVDYGVTNFKINLIDLNEFKSIKGSSTENYIKAWENAALWTYETKQSSFLPTNYLTEDELYYIVYEDGSLGHNNIAYGWATFITNSEISKDHPDYANHSLYGEGYYNWKDEFAAEGILVEDLYEGALVDKEIATAVFQNEILPTFIQHVDTYLKNNLPEYKFTQSEKDALISIAYQYGNIYGFADAYKNSLNEDGTINAEKIKTNFEVNGIKVFNYEATKNDRKYANWLLFTQGIYIDRLGNEILARMNLKNWDGDFYSNDEHTFPVYNQYDERWSSYPFGGPNGLPTVPANNGKQKTVASSGCGSCALSVVLSGYLGEVITPDILTQKLDEVYPSGSYYSPGNGSCCFYFYDNKLLKEFGCTGKSTSSREEALEALKAGYAVIGGEEGHMLTFVPASSEDAALGYTFRIIDSARGHNVLCKDFSDADRIVRGSATVTSIIYPPGS